MGFFVTQTPEALRSQLYDTPLPRYRCKVVRCGERHVEASFTAHSEQSVIRSRLGRSKFERKRDLSVLEREAKDLENKARATKLARQKVRYFVKSIEADHMLTFTTRSAIYERSEFAKTWERFRKLFLKRYPKWRYVGVPEKHDSEDTSEAKRGSYHLHVAVQGKQDIRWLRRCWLLALGQTGEEVSDWYVCGIQLGAKSLGAVNVQYPNKRWGNNKTWRANSLSGYLSKYISKEFDSVDAHSKKYWAVKGISVQVEKYWIQTHDWSTALSHLNDIIVYSCCDNLTFFGNNIEDVGWVTGEIPRNTKITRLEMSSDFFAD